VGIGQGQPVKLGGLFADESFTGNNLALS